MERLEILINKAIDNYHTSKPKNDFEINCMISYIKNSFFIWLKNERYLNDKAYSIPKNSTITINEFIKGREESFTKFDGNYTDVEFEKYIGSRNNCSIVDAIFPTLRFCLNIPIGEQKGNVTYLTDEIRYTPSFDEFGLNEKFDIWKEKVQLLKPFEKTNEANNLINRITKCNNFEANPKINSILEGYIQCIEDIFSPKFEEQFNFDTLPYSGLPTIDRNIIKPSWIYQNFINWVFKCSLEAFYAWFVYGKVHIEKIEFILVDKDGKPKIAQLRKFIETITGDTENTKQAYYKKVFGLTVETSSKTANNLDKKVFGKLLEEIQMNKIKKSR